MYFLCGGCLNIQALTVTLMCFLKYLESLYTLFFQSTSFSDLAIIFFWKDYLQKVQMQLFSRRNCLFFKEETKHQAFEILKEGI